MKRRVHILAMLLIFLTSAASAQNLNRERLESYKIAFFTQRLNLTPSEAEKFWPLYNNFQYRKAIIQKERMDLTRKFNQENSTLTDKEMTEMADKLIELEVRETDVSMTFHKNIKDVLPPVKVLRLYQAEDLYKITLLNQIQERRQERPNPVLR